jgi:hypothetical protein|nr:MAG TPA: hypothetical protein [Caudoviricetes sp.]
MRDVDLYGPNRAIKEAIAEATGFPVWDVLVARDLRQGKVKHCIVHETHLVSHEWATLEHLPELVDGFVRELEIIGKDRLHWLGGCYVAKNTKFRVTTSQAERTDHLYYKLWRWGFCVDTAYDPEEAKLFLDTGKTWYERQKGNNETDDNLQQERVPTMHDPEEEV